MTQTEALRLALEALEIDLVFLRNVKPFKGQKDLASDCVAMTEETITAITAALEAKDEPVAWMNDSTPSGIFARHIEGAKNFGCTVPLYTTPPQPVIDESAAKRIATSLGWEPKRKPLTDEEIVSIVREASRGSAIRRDGSTSLRIARAIEAKLKEKNT